MGGMTGTYGGLRSQAQARPQTGGFHPAPGHHVQYSMSSPFGYGASNYSPGNMFSQPMFGGNMFGGFGGYGGFNPYQLFSPYSSGGGYYNQLASNMARVPQMNFGRTYYPSISQAPMGVVEPRNIATSTPNYNFSEA